MPSWQWAKKKQLLKNECFLRFRRLSALAETLHIWPRPPPPGLPVQAVHIPSLSPGSGLVKFSLSVGVSFFLSHVTVLTHVCHYCFPHLCVPFSSAVNALTNHSSLSLLPRSNVYAFQPVSVTFAFSICDVAVFFIF